jgi:hypothetical protein
VEGKRGKPQVSSRAFALELTIKNNNLFLEAEAEILLPLRQNVHGRGKVMGRCDCINIGENEMNQDL